MLVYRAKRLLLKSMICARNLLAAAGARILLVKLEDHFGVPVCAVADLLATKSVGKGPRIGQSDPEWYIFTSKFARSSVGPCS